MKRFFTWLLFVFAFCSFQSKAQVGTVVGWGMSVCNTFSFSICPSQTIVPFNYGSQTWACNNQATPDISFNIMGPVWRVCRNNYSFTANVPAQLNGFSPGGAPQNFPIAVGQTLTPSAYMVVSGVNCVVFALNGTANSFTFNQNTFSISISQVSFTGNSYTLCTNTQSSITLSVTPPPQGGPWTFNWQPGNVAGNPVTVSPTVSTVYTMIATTNGFSCTNTATVAVTVTNCCVQPTLVANVTPSSVCAGQPSTLTVTGAGPGGTYTWIPGNLTGSSVVVSPTAATIYTVTGTNSVNCNGSQTVQVLISPLPVVNAGSNSTVCSGNTLSLTCGAGTSFSWTGPGGFVSGLQNPILANAQPSNAGVYSVSLTGLNGCNNNGTVNVVISAPPVITATNGGPFCQGTNINLSVTAAQNYSWAGPGGFVNNTQSPLLANAQPSNAGVYNVTVSTAGGCVGMASTTVVVNPSPVAGAGNNGPVCAGLPVGFSSNAANSYTWFGPGGFNSSLQNPVLAAAQASNAGTYTLTVTNNLGCTGSSTTTLTINPLPPANANNPFVCPGQSINLFANGGVSFSWSGPLGFSSGLQNPVINNGQINMSGGYTVTVGSISGCTASAVANVTVAPVPNPTIGSNMPVCENGALMLFGTGSGSFFWSGPNSYTSALQNPTIMNVQTTASGVYTLMNTVGSCTVSATASISIETQPTFSVTSNSPVCQNSPLVINISGGNSYVTFGPSSFTSTGSNPVINSAGPLNAGNYTIVATGTNACTTSSVIGVQVIPAPLVTVFGATACAEHDFSLSASGGSIYSWSGPQGFFSNLQSPLFQNASAEMAGDYSITITDANGCSVNAIVNVDIHPIPDISVTANSPVCANSTVVLIGASVLGTGYSWNGPDGFFSPFQIATIPGVQTNASGTYTLSVSDNIGCTARATVDMEIFEAPMVSISSEIVKGCVPLCVNFAPKSSIELIECNWNFGEGNNTVGTGNVSWCYKNAGFYRVRAEFKDIHGCINTATFGINAWPRPFADFNYSPASPMEGDSLSFTDASNGANIAEWNWHFSGDGDAVVLRQNTIKQFEHAGNYQAALVIRSDHGCYDTIVKNIFVAEDFGIYVPDAFSPNDDGVNDLFQPKGFGIAKYELNIFDRWGEKIFSTRDFTKAWDGTLKGSDHLMDDTYVWKIYVSNLAGKHKELCGTVTIIK